MRYYQLAVIVSAVACVSATVLVTLVVAALWPWLQWRLNAGAAADRARRLASLRLAPLLLGTLSAIIAAVVFLRFEPRDTTEPIGFALAAGAAVLPVMAGLALARIILAFRASRGCARLLQSCGRTADPSGRTSLWIVDTSYPVAAVLGVFRPRLVLATRIIEECSPGELASVINHELAHIRRRDNLLRAALRCLPDPLALLAAGRAIEAAWTAACEEAADDAAAGDRVEARTELAGALVKVAGMVQSPRPPWMPAIAFYEGSNLERRVTRLLGEVPSPERDASGVLAVGIGTCAAVIACTDLIAPHLHQLMELAVGVLP